MNVYAKITESGGVETAAVAPTRSAAIESLLAKGFLPLTADTTEVDLGDLGELDSIEVGYREESDQIVRYKYVSRNAPRVVANRMSYLKGRLNSSDYRVTKNQELVLAGFDPEYDPAELHAEREAIRVEIRELESLNA